MLLTSQLVILKLRRTEWKYAVIYVTAYVTRDANDKGRDKDKTIEDMKENTDLDILNTPPQVP